MSDVFLSRRWNQPLDSSLLAEMEFGDHGCFALYGVDWKESFVSADSRRMLCHFTAPDREAVRVARRGLRVDPEVDDLPDAVEEVLWVGTVHAAPDGDLDLAEANVVVERSFDSPVVMAELQAVENAHLHCLQSRQVRFMGSFFSLDRRRMSCLYRAPDAESVRIAQRQAGMPVDRVWPCRRLAPEAS